MRMSEMLKDKKVLESFIRVFVNEANICAISDNERMEALHKAIAKNDASALCEALTGCELMFLLGKAVERAKFAPTSGGFSEHPRVYRRRRRKVLRLYAPVAVCLQNLALLAGGQAETAYQP